MTKGKGVFKKVALSIATIIVGFIVTIVILATKRGESNEYGYQTWQKWI
jgi:hypothetical protein